MSGTFEYSATQDEGYIYITVIIPKSVPPTSLDVTVNDVLLNVNSQKNGYTTNIDLRSYVCTKDSSIRCRFNNGCLKITLTKTKQEIWPEPITIREGDIEEYPTMTSLIQRRTESFNRFQTEEKERLREQAQKKYEEEQRIKDEDLRRRRAEQEKMRQIEKERKNKIMEDIESNKETAESVAAKLPEIRNSKETIVLETSFTKRSAQVPAREGRTGIYLDKVDETNGVLSTLNGTDIETLKTKAYKMAQIGNISYAIEICRELSDETRGANAEIAALYSSLLLHEGRYDNVVDVTNVILKNIALKTKQVESCYSTGGNCKVMDTSDLNNDDNILAYVERSMIYSAKLKSQLISLRAAGLCGLKLYRTALKTYKMAQKITPENEGINRDCMTLNELIASVGK